MRQLLIITTFLLVTLTSCSQEVKTEFRDANDKIITETESNFLDIFKVLSYEGDDLKKCEVFSKSQSKKDSTGKPAKKLLLIELYNVPESDKKDLRAKYPANDWTFEFYFVKRKKSGDFFVDQKETIFDDIKSDDIKTDSLIAEKKLIFGKRIDLLIDKKGRTICRIDSNINGDKIVQGKTYKFYYKNDVILLGVTYNQHNGNAIYTIYENFEKGIFVESFSNRDFQKLKQKYFPKQDISYYETPKLEPN